MSISGILIVIAFISKWTIDNIAISYLDLNYCFHIRAAIYNYSGISSIEGKSSKY